MTDDIDTSLMEELRKEAVRCAEDHGWDGKKFPPGKMEGNPWWIPYLYEQIVLEGDGETVGPWECSELTREEAELFGLRDTWAVGIREDDNGFVLYLLMTESEYNDLQFNFNLERGED